MSGLANTCVAVVGATGVVGRQVVARLRTYGVPVRLLGRRPEALAQLADADAWQVIDARDQAACAASVAGCGLVINAVSPMIDVAERVAKAAVSVGAHYLDVSAEQLAARQLFERLDAPARKRGTVVLPAVGLMSTLADWTTASVRPSEPLLALHTTYVFDQWAMSTGGQRALFANLHAPCVRWDKARWISARFADRRITCATGASFGGDRPAVWFPSPDIIVLARAFAPERLDAYLSPSRQPRIADAMWAAGLALAFAPKTGLAHLLATFPTSEAMLARTHVAVMTHLTTRNAYHHIMHTGYDPYLTTAHLAVEIALLLAAHPPTRAGVFAPSEILPLAAYTQAIERATQAGNWHLDSQLGSRE